MLCSPLTATSSRKLVINDTNNNLYRQTYSQQPTTTGGKSLTSSTISIISSQPAASQQHHENAPTTVTPPPSTTATTPASSSSTMTTSTTAPPTAASTTATTTPAAAVSNIREIKSKTVGLFSSSSALYGQAAAAKSTTITPPTNNPIGGHQIERRQAISMERLDSITASQRIFGAANRNGGSSHTLFQRQQQQQQQHHHHHHLQLTRDKESGSLSSGSNSSLDDLSASDDQQQQQQHQHDLRKTSNHQKRGARASGLTRSASRVSRFKSAKEFFERLSSIQNGAGGASHSSPKISKIDRSPVVERQRAVVLTRYTQVGAGGASPMISARPTAISTTSASDNNNNSPPRSRLHPPAANTVAAPFSFNRINQTQTRLPSSTAPKRAEEVAQEDTSSADQRAKPDSTATTPVLAPVTEIPSAASCEATEAHTTSRAIPKLAASSSSESSSSSSSGSCDDNQASGSETCDVIVVFRGGNVIVGNGSLLNKRNKQLRIKFDENNPTTTFEYPSEEAMLAEPDSPPGGRSPSPDAQTAGQQTSSQSFRGPTTSTSSKSKLPLRGKIAKLIRP